MRDAGRKQLSHYIILVVIGIAVIAYLMPIYWIVATSLKAPGDIVTKIPKFLFRLTFDNYRKLMPAEVPGKTYVFLVEALASALFFALPRRLWSRFHISTIEQHAALLLNCILALTCLHTVVFTMNFQFLLLTVYLGTAYWLISKTVARERQMRFGFVNVSVFALVAICISLADGGSKYFHQLLNSLIIGVGSTILAVGLGTFAAYAFSRFKIIGKEDWLFFILSTRMLPPVVVVIPIYLMYSALGLRDTHAGLILLYTTFNVSFAVWLMKGFVDEIPKEYEDAALVDGYTRFQTFIKVVLPQSVTGIAATAVFCLITAWNEFAFALVLTEVGGKAVTAPPSITSATGSGGVDWGKIAAATFVFLLPVAMFTFLMRKHLLRGVTFGAVKK